jgi:hypothetical protein
MSENLPPLGNRTFYLKGFTLTRKIEFEGEKSAFSDILREIADVIDETGLDGTSISSFSMNNNQTLKFTLQLMEKK